MEEDYGNLQIANDIINDSHPFIRNNETLVCKQIKILEKLDSQLPQQRNGIKPIRSILGQSLQNQKLEKTWKLYLEGVQIEQLYGNLRNTELALKTLVQSLDFNG